MFHNVIKLFTIFATVINDNNSPLLPAQFTTTIATSQNSNNSDKW